MITPEQSRAARGWLNWTQAKLAGQANVALSTVRDFEKGRHVPQAANLEAIRKSLEQEGVSITFEDNGKPRGIEMASSSDQA